MLIERRQMPRECFNVRSGKGSRQRLGDSLLAEVLHAAVDQREQDFFRVGGGQTTFGHHFDSRVEQRHQMAARGYGRRMIEGFELGRDRERLAAQIAGDLFGDCNGIRMSFEAKIGAAESLGAQLRTAYRYERMHRAGPAASCHECIQHRRRQRSARVKNDRLTGNFTGEIVGNRSNFRVLRGNKNDVRGY